MAKRTYYHAEKKVIRKEGAYGTTGNSLRKDKNS